LEVPPEVVEALGGGKRPRVIITINGHSWRSRVAIMRGRFLLGLSNANRDAAGVVAGEEVEIEPRVALNTADKVFLAEGRLVVGHGDDRRVHDPGRHRGVSPPPGLRPPKYAETLGSFLYDRLKAVPRDLMAEDLRGPLGTHRDRWNGWDDSPAARQRPRWP
jgi:hypothetical protein